MSAEHLANERLPLGFILIGRNLALERRQQEIDLRLDVAGEDVLVAYDGHHERVVELLEAALGAALRAEAAGQHGPFGPRPGRQLAHRDWAGREAIVAGLRMLTLRRFVEEKDGLFTARPEEKTALAYYANSIEPLTKLRQAAFVSAVR